TIRISHGVPITMPLAWMAGAIEQGITAQLPNYGEAYVIEAIRNDASAENANLLAAGEIDIGFTSTGPLINANTGLGGDLRILADVLQGGTQGHEGLWFLVLEDSGIESIEDLEGRTIGSLGFGTFSDLALRVALQDAGLDPERD